MNATLLYRIAAALLFLFAVLHTFGFLGFKPPTAEGLAVRDAMTSVQFEIKGASGSYGKFYMGFGLTVTAYLNLLRVSCVASRQHGNQSTAKRPRSRLGICCCPDCLSGSDGGLLLPIAGAILGHHRHLSGLGRMAAW